MTAVLDDIVTIREQVRVFVGKSVDGKPWPLCGPVTWLVSLRTGWPFREGCYIRPDGSHIKHAWNAHSVGRICDATADQFNEPDPGIRFAPSDDPRYAADCTCPLWS